MKMHTIYIYIYIKEAKMSLPLGYWVGKQWVQAFKCQKQNFWALN